MKINTYFQAAYEKTKSEGERIHQKLKRNLTDISLENEKNENISERFLRVTSRADALELNIILRDSAMHSIEVTERKLQERQQLKLSKNQKCNFNQKTTNNLTSTLSAFELSNDATLIIPYNMYG